MTMFQKFANATHMKDAAYARDAIAMTARHTPNRRARLAMAQMAFGQFGNYTDEAKALWKAYYISGAPKA